MNTSIGCQESDTRVVGGKKSLNSRNTPITFKDLGEANILHLLHIPWDGTQLTMTTPESFNQHLHSIANS